MDKRLILPDRKAQLRYDVYSCASRPVYCILI